MVNRTSRSGAALLLAAVLASGCATLSPEARATLRKPGAASMLQAPPPLRDERHTVTTGDTAENGALIAATAALVILTALVNPTGLLGFGGLPGLGGTRDQAVQVNAGSVEGVSPSDVLSVAVQERLVALGYARPGFVPGVRVRFESRTEQLPAGVAVSTGYVLKAQVDSVKVAAGGVPTRLAGSLTLYEERRAILHSSCAPALTAEEAEQLSRQDAWLALLRPCAVALVAPFEAPTAR